MYLNTDLTGFALPDRTILLICGGYEKGGSRSEPRNVARRRLTAGDSNSR